MYKYKFSVIIPIYNVEDYLKEAIESVINQTIGFEENIQLILINDGSTDKSEAICMEYKQKYPENIIYENQQNAGVSCARNAGMKYIEGKYVNFLDGDDKWNLDAFEIVWNFFENNDINIVACRRQYFEAKKGYHVLDYVFEKDGIVDIEKDYQNIHLHAASTFFESNLAKKHRFDSNLKFGEDAKFTTEIILEEEKFGVLRSAEYNYRQRNNKSSVMQNFISDDVWYNKTLQNYHQKVIEKCIGKYGKIIAYVQYLLMFDIKGRINKQIPDFLDEDSKREYKEKVLEILRKIDDYIICEQKKYYASDKIFALSLKYGRDIAKELEFDDGKLYFNNLSIMSIKNNKSILKIENFIIEKNILTIDGKIKVPFSKEQYEIYMQNCEEKINLQIKEIEKDFNNVQTDETLKEVKMDENIAQDSNCFSIGREKKFEYSFLAKIKLNKNNNLSFILDFMNNKEILGFDVEKATYNEKRYKVRIKEKEIFIEKIAVLRKLFEKLS